MKIPIVWLLFVCVSFAQSHEALMATNPSRAQGRFLRVTALKDLSLVTPRARAWEFDDDEVIFTGGEHLVAKALAQSQIKSLALPRVAPLIRSSGTSVASPTFLPPSAIDESSCGGVLASDGALAASSTYLIEVANACVEALNPNTGAVIAGPVSISTFLGSSSGATGDARALYDQVSGRFIISAEDHNRNKVFLAVSQSSNPTQGWNVYSFSMAGTCNPGYGDFPMLGQTYQEAGDPKGGIYLSWNIACPNQGGISTFVGAISKTLAFAGSPINSVNGFQGLSVNGVHVDTVQPVNVINPGDHPPGEFLVNSFNLNFGGYACAKGCNGVVVWDFYNGIPAPGGSQKLTSITVATTSTYYPPPNAPEPGCAVNTCGPNTQLAIMSGEAAYSSGSVFTALNDGMGILTLELEPSVNASGVITGVNKRNEICVACGGLSNGGQVYYGTILPDSQRNWVMVLNYSAPGKPGCTPDPYTCVYPSAAFVTRRATEAQNTLADTGTILALGQAFYKQLNSQGVNRWGDYTAAAPAYLTPNSYWIESEFAESNGNWGKAIGKIADPSISQP